MTDATDRPTDLCLAQKLHSQLQCCHRSQEEARATLAVRGLAGASADRDRVLVRISGAAAVSPCFPRGLRTLACWNVEYGWTANFILHRATVFSNCYFALPSYE